MVKIIEDFIRRRWLYLWVPVIMGIVLSAEDKPMAAMMLYCFVFMFASATSLEVARNHQRALHMLPVSGSIRGIVFWFEGVLLFPGVFFAAGCGSILFQAVFLHGSLIPNTLFLSAIAFIIGISAVFFILQQTQPATIQTMSRFTPQWIIGSGGFLLACLLLIGLCVLSIRNPNTIQGTMLYLISSVFAAISLARTPKGIPMMPTVSLRKTLRKKSPQGPVKFGRSSFWAPWGMELLIGLLFLAAAAAGTGFFWALGYSKLSGELSWIKMTSLFLPGWLIIVVMRVPVWCVPLRGLRMLPRRSLWLMGYLISLVIMPLIFVLLGLAFFLLITLQPVSGLILLYVALILFDYLLLAIVLFLLGGPVAMSLSIMFLLFSFFMSIAGRSASSINAHGISLLFLPLLIMAVLLGAMYLLITQNSGVYHRKPYDPNEAIHWR